MKTYMMRIYQLVNLSTGDYIDGDNYEYDESKNLFIDECSKMMGYLHVPAHKNIAMLNMMREEGSHKIAGINGDMFELFVA